MIMAGSMLPTNVREPDRLLHTAGSWLQFWDIPLVIGYDFPMKSASPGAPSRKWIWVASIWTGIGLFDACQTIFSMRAAGMHHNWGSLFVTTLFFWLPWALATPLITRLGRRYPPVQLRPVSGWLIHLSVCTAIGLLLSGWIAAMELLLDPWARTGPPDPFVTLWIHKFNNQLLSFLIFYFVVLATSYMFDSRERLAFQQAETARLNEQLSEARLNALRRQIEPHFLFNTLNSIAGLVREGRNDAAVNMIAGLSDFLRRVLENSNRHESPLGEEMAFLQKYLEIQKVRFAERLRLTVEVPSELYPAQVPSLILQPIVENAVKHGISRRVQGGEVRISASRSNGMLTLSVYNDGPRLPANWEGSRTGIGISNMRTRLQRLYGESFELKMRNQEPDGVEVSVSVPFRKA